MKFIAVLALAAMSLAQDEDLTSCDALDCSQYDVEGYSFCCADVVVGDYTTNTCANVENLDYYATLFEYFATDDYEVSIECNASSTLVMGATAVAAIAASF